MRIPLPKNTLVSLTLVGAVLVAAVSLALAFPSAVPGMTTDKMASNDNAGTGTSIASDAPTPNPDFTPAVQTQSGGEHEEHEGYEHEESEEHEEHEEHEFDSLAAFIGNLV